MKEREVFNRMVVFSEPKLCENGTVNSAMNEILAYYKLFSKEVVCVAPGVGNPFSINSVEFVPFSFYSKENRLFLKNIIKVRRFIKEVIKKNKGAVFQFRLPSVYALQLFLVSHDLFNKEKVCFYLAGDWLESLQANYPRYKLLPRVINYIQDLVLRKSVVVFTGDKLLNEHKKHKVIGHAFYSTTHTLTDIVSVDPSVKCKVSGICFIGTLDSRKNPEFMIKLSKLNSMGDKVFHWLGDGYLYSDIKSKAPGNVMLHGHVSDRSIFSEILEDCKYFILPSYTEGTSKTLPEVMARGLVPIAFKGVGSNDFIIDDQENGFLVSIDDVQQVADIILNLDEDYEKYSNVIFHSREYAKNMTVENEMSKMFEFLRQKLNA